MAIPKFKAFKWCCTNLGQDTRLGPNTVTNIEIAAHIVRVFGKYNSLFSTIN